jgi:hypothetical protein
VPVLDNPDPKPLRTSPVASHYTGLRWPPRASGAGMTEPEFDAKACGSCGQRLARLEVGLCKQCREQGD